MRREIFKEANTYKFIRNRLYNFYFDFTTYKIFWPQTIIIMYEK
jgi:hypothetical protein